jgi:chromosome segregation ATPase
MMSDYPAQLRAMYSDLSAVVGPPEPGTLEHMIRGAADHIESIERKLYESSCKLEETVKARDAAHALYVEQLKARKELDDVRDGLEFRLEACEATMKRDHDEHQASLERWQSEPTYRIRQEQAERIDELEQLVATAYQLAGLVGAPLRFLDAYALGKRDRPPEEGYINALLPVNLDELDEFKALQSRLDGVLSLLRDIREFGVSDDDGAEPLYHRIDAILVERREIK